MSRKWRLSCVIAIIIGVFAYSAFINVQRDQNSDMQQSMGR
jgi:hypothetical protein